MPTSYYFGFVVIMFGTSRADKCRIRKKALEALDSLACNVAEHIGRPANEVLRTIAQEINLACTSHATTISDDAKLLVDNDVKH